MDAARLTFRVLGRTVTITKGDLQAKWLQVKCWQLSGGLNL